MFEIAVVGSLNLDTTIRVPRLPAPGETILGTGHFADTGGKGANQAIAAARLGRSVAMVGMVGDDAAGRLLRAALEAAGVGVDAVRVSSTAPTGMAIITVDAAGENTIVVDPAANGTFGPDEFSDAFEVVAGARVVVLQLEIPIPTVAAAVAASNGIVILNPAPAADLPLEVLAGIDVLVPNATELARLARTAVPHSPDEAIEAARALVGPGAVVVTLGALGAVVVDGDGATHIAAPLVDPVDPTAAGDAFCGGLADALVRGESLRGAVEWAVRCGAVTATRWGAQASLPSRDEVLTMEESS